MVEWYRSQGRDLPWRKTLDPYAIFIAEIMLQQTQVQRVIPRWLYFVSTYPDWTALAAAPTSNLIRDWVGLGYNNRIIRAHKAAYIVVNKHQGYLPSDQESLETLPGVGSYTRSAIQCFAFNKSVPVVDVNVQRVLRRFYGIKSPLRARDMIELAKQSLPKRHSYEWNQGLMDIGATICKAKVINCSTCPLSKSCYTSSTGKTPSQVRHTSSTEYKGSNRYFRGQVMKLFTQHDSDQKLSIKYISTTLSQGWPDHNMGQIKKALLSLQRDELLELHPSSKEPSCASLPKTILPSKTF